MINNRLSALAKSKLVIKRDARERVSISNSIGYLERILSSHLGNIQVKKFGSFTRNTILPRNYDSNSDIDLMIIFDGNYTPQTYRKYIFDALSSTYTASTLNYSFPAIKLELDHIIFDLVPTLTANNMFNHPVYYIPDDNSEWTKTDPNDINDKLAKYNQRFGGNQIRDLIRLCKYWNANLGHPLESYEMEHDILDTLKIGDHDIYCRFLHSLESIANHIAGTKQAVEHIRSYNGGFFQEANTEKQLQWLNKLLPGI